MLRTNGQPIMVIEAKSLGSGLQNGARQAVDYAMDANRQARYFAITDGQNWEIYDTNRPANDMRVSSFDVMATAAAEVCLKAMALWRPAVEHGSVMAAETPLVGMKEVEQNFAVAASVTEATVEQQTALANKTPTPRPIVQYGSSKTAASTKWTNEMRNDWMPIKDFAPEPNSKPSGIRFPDGSDLPVNSWVDVSVKIVEWLSKNRYLNEGNCRVRFSDRAKRYILSDTPIHAHGKRFHTVHEVGDLYLEGNHSGPNHVKNAQVIIKHAYQDPTQFKVRLR